MFKYLGTTQIQISFATKLQEHVEFWESLLELPVFLSMDLGEIEWDAMDWTDLAQDRD
jgi:hypothetical protein